jgi:NAD(P)-dependent dehydrogenase (short-subunit alcohol dehydrogenase family)
VLNASGSSRSVLITGGTGALGSAVAERFVADGHHVAATYLDEEERDALVAELGRRADHLLAVSADVTDGEALQELVTRVTQAQGPVEVFVHLVGGWQGGEPVQKHSIETWNEMIRLNLLSAFLCCRAVLPAMLEGGWGRIVLTSARTAREGPREGQAGYAVAKAGVAILAETIAEETRGTGVTANVIAPSIVDTPANRKAMPTEDPSRWVTPEQVAGVIAFLGSEDAGVLRGAWLPVYGSA